jgi:hypothetical protein
MVVSDTEWSSNSVIVRESYLTVGDVNRGFEGFAPFSRCSRQVEMASAAWCVARIAC